MTDSKAKLQKEINIIQHAIGKQESEPPINWNYYLSQSEIDTFKQMKPLMQQIQNNPNPDWSIFNEEQHALLQKTSRIYIKVRGANKEGGIH